MYFTKNTLLFLLITLCLFVKTKCNVCNETLLPYSTYVRITCTYLTNGFPQFKRSVLNMECNNCNLPVLDETTNLKTFKGPVFNLNNSHIKRIEDSAFTFFTSNVERFVFDDNEISYVAPNVFTKFMSLDGISLKNNKLSNNGSKLFVKTVVTNLDLSRNHFTGLNGLFSELRVHNLTLSHNAIKELPANTFREVLFGGGRQWRYQPYILDLSHNDISEILPGSFGFAKPEVTPHRLVLSYNKLTKLGNEMFGDLSPLYYLQLEGNRISKLEPNCFKGLSKLTTLYLRNNQIENLPPGVFSHLEKLDFLDLSRNSFKRFNSNSFNGLGHLNFLNISHNALKELKATDLLPLGTITTLDVSDVRIHAFDLQTLLDHHVRLHIVHLNDNFWKCKDLMEMYKVLNKKSYGFAWPSKHFDVPNLHGIACSRSPIASYDGLSFEDFLEIVSEDRFVEDFYEKRNDNVELKIHQEIKSTMRNLRELFYIVLVLLVVVLIVFSKFVVHKVYVFIYNRKHEANGKINFAYR